MCVFFGSLWVFAAACRFSPVAATGSTLPGGAQVSSLWWLLLVQSMDFIIVTHELSCPEACGILPT